MKTVIPLTQAELRNNGVDEYIQRIKQCECNEILISVESGDSFESMENKAKEAKLICDKFHEAGIKTSIWIHPTLNLIPFREYVNLQPLTGESINGKCCPMDDDYCRDAGDYAALMVKHTGTKTLVLEDDFRMQFPSLPACCFCEHHMKFYSEYIGKAVTREEMEENLFGAPNVYREAWVKGSQAGLIKLAKAIREAVDAVDPNVEICFSTGPANCGADGTDVFELIDILKGKHEKATIRLSGGPYWQEGFYLTRNMMSAVELERYTALKCKQRGIIGRAEGDCFPRPRHIVPASHLEIFHTALLFDGNCGEILKYMMDYTASPRYEQGYTNAHIKSLPMYDKIEEIIQDTELVGFNPVEDFALQAYTHHLNPIPENEAFESPVRNFCTDNALPTAHEGNGVNILFGDRARKIDLQLLKNGSIIDLVAAKTLTELGVDVGIEAIHDCTFPGGREYFIEENENVGIAMSFDAAEIQLNHRASIKSYFIPNTGGVNYHSVKGGTLCSDRVVSSYLYENKDGLKFLMFNFDANQCSTRRANQGVFTNYCRERLIFKSYEWLHGSKLDAYCEGHPWLYTLVRKSENKCVVGLWNHCADDIDLPVVELGDAYQKATFINCDGTFENNRAVITNGLGAFKYGFIELTK